jgi:hypothetical protein
MEFEYLTLINLKTKKNAERLGILNEKIDIFEVNKKLIHQFKHIFELQNYEQ